MDKRNWEIIYSAYIGMEKKAVELIYKEMSSYILRDSGIYTVHVLPCKKEQNCSVDKNAVIIGLYNESMMIQKYIEPKEIKDGGYVVKVIDNPDNKSLKLAVITAYNPASLFYGAVDFVDDYFIKAAPIHGAVRLCNEIFDFEMPDYYNSSAAAIKTRSVFTWGHTINDYRDYIENMARLKLNQLIIWNDYVPINIKDVIDYAHEYGIKVISGFAWGWSTDCKNIDLDNLESLADDIVNTYIKQYADTGCDGIYFQSFTELPVDTIGDKLIAEVVTDFVNTVSQRLFEKYPDLHILFGLHATSVKDHLEFIGKVDKRIEIMWEDCGSFPFAYDPYVVKCDEYEQTKTLVNRIIKLRKYGDTSFLFKGFMTLDWVDRFVHQAGPYILGNSSETIIDHDRNMLKPSWRQLQSGWLQNGKYAHSFANYIYECSDGKAMIGMAGQFAGAIWFPEALCAQILWECDRPYDEIFEKVSKRKCITFA